MKKMRVLAILITILSLTSKGFAHNMPETIKKDKIIEAMAHLTKNITPYDIHIEASPLTLDLDFQLSRFESGDKDIDSFTLTTTIDEEDYILKCDLLSGEYGRERAIYFLIYKNCSLQNLKTEQSTSISITTQSWDDWKY